MKQNFSCIEKGDKLYIVYQDLNNKYKIGEAFVTGFSNWSYEDTDRWGESYGTKSGKNINYEFEGIKFSRSLEYCLNETYFTDSPMHSSYYADVLGDLFVTVFIAYDDAKNYVINILKSVIKSKQEQIDGIELEKLAYIKNLNEIEK